MDEMACFIGHRRVMGTFAYKRLRRAIETAFLQGYKDFFVGTHGEFDELALKPCKELRKKVLDLNICVVITSLSQIKRAKVHKEDCVSYAQYDDVDTIMFNIEQKFFKGRIIESNKQMVDNLLCGLKKKRRRS